MSLKPIGAILGIVVCLLFTSLISPAQGTTTRITGIVQDNAGAAVSGATVTLKSEGTAVSQSVETKESGIYAFDLIQAGTYTISVEKQGFKKYVSTGNIANVNRRQSMSRWKSAELQKQ